MSEKELSYNIINKALELFAGQTENGTVGFTKSEMEYFFCKKLNKNPKDLEPKLEGNRKQVFEQFLSYFAKSKQKDILLELCQVERSQGYHTWSSKEQRQELALLLSKENVTNYPPLYLLIFAAHTKPDINISNLLTKELNIPKNDELYLVYNFSENHKSISWNELLHWWNENSFKNNYSNLNTLEKSLVNRLTSSLTPTEKRFFEIYFNNFLNNSSNNYPALIPQVWLHYDRYSNEYRQKISGNISFFRQKLDFILITDNKIIVIEIDGKEHYSLNNIANEEIYTSQVSYDRKLKLLWNYDVYRFSNFELNQQTAEFVVVDFFNKLLIN